MSGEILGIFLRPKSDETLYYGRLNVKEFFGQFIWNQQQLDQVEQFDLTPKPQDRKLGELTKNSGCPIIPTSYPNSGKS